MTRFFFPRQYFFSPLIRLPLILFLLISLHPGLFCRTRVDFQPVSQDEMSRRSDSAACMDTLTANVRKFVRFDHAESGSGFFSVRLSYFQDEFERAFFYDQAAQHGIYIADKKDYHLDSTLFMTILNKEEAFGEFSELLQYTAVARSTMSETAKDEMAGSFPFYHAISGNNQDPAKSPLEGAFDCSGASVACSANTYTFPAGTSGSAPPAVAGYPNYGCLGSTPAPAWFYMQVGVAGNIIINISKQGGAANDVDFICWGPFGSLTDGCAIGLTGSCPKPLDPCCSNVDPGCIFPKGNITDCSYSGNSTETCHITNAQVGDIYILLITNFSQQSGTITFSQTGGTGVTNCNLIFHCSVIDITTNPTPCDDMTSTFGITGSIEFSNPSPTGTLTITDNTAIPPVSQTFFPPFTSPKPYSLTNIPCDGAVHVLSAVFSDSLNCNLSQQYTAPAAPCPQAHIAGGGTICNDGVQQANVSVTFPSGTPPFTFIYAINGVNQPPVVYNSTAAYQINTAVPGVYTLVSLATPNQGCPTGIITGSATVTVNPIPAVNAVSSQVLCHQANSSLVHFTGTVAGAVYNWVNSNPAIGLAAIGTGDIASFTATNLTNAPITGTITITPAFTNSGVTCTGSPTSFTITVNPVPTVSPVPNQLLCNQSATAPVLLAGSVPGTVYSWTNTNTSFGLAASGTGNIASFVVSSASAVSETATITVTPAFTNAGVTCTGNPLVFTITVNPVPTVNSSVNQVLCHQMNTMPISLTGNIPGTVYGWVNSNPTIGLAASGTGDIASFAVTNITNAPLTATITATPTFSNAGLTCTGAPTLFQITVNPIPTVGTPTNQILCNQSATTAVNFTGFVTGTLYSWVNTDPTTGLAASGTGDIAAFTATNATNAPVTANITVTPSFTNTGLTCTGTPATFSITVNPIPTVNVLASQVLCHQSTTADIHFSGFVPGTIYNWVNSDPSIGLAASGTGDISSFAVTNITNAPVTATITATPTFTNAGLTCTGSPMSFQVTVNPIPTVGAQTDQVLCHQTSTAAVSFTGFVPGTAYNWVNSNPSIGLAASGTGNILSFNATNNTNAPVTASITVTPSYSGTGLTCTGTPTSFSITVNPIPTVNALANQALCHQSTTAAIHFTGFVPGTLYNWVNSDPTIGLAASGNGDIASFAVTNITNGPVTATITATPTFTNGGLTCTGNPASFQVTVNPIPTVGAQTDQVLCHQTSAAAVTFTGFVTGTVYNWVNSNTSIGLAAAGTGNISSFTATNTTNAPVTATITTTPAFTNTGLTCTGSPASFQVTVNPIPTVNALASQVLCHQAMSATVNFTGYVPGTQYNWVNSNPTIGLAASGTGDISSFAVTNTTNAPVTATITATPTFTNSGLTCTGSPASFQLTVNPIPTVNTVTNQALCHQFSTTPVSFSGNVAGTVYTWVNSNTSIGLAAAGTGNIPSFTATNISAAPVTATITVTPVFTNASVTCTGTPTTFTIRVNPLPVPTITGPAAVCLNLPATYSTEDFQGSYVWNIPAGGVITLGQSTKQVEVLWNTIGTYTITVNYVDANGCTAVLPTSRQVVVNSLPSPTLTGAITVCAGDTKTYQTQTGAQSYSWGLPASGIVKVAGGGTLDDHVTIQWIAAGTYSISVNYVIGTGCTAQSPFVLPVTVNALPTPVITGSSPVCALSTQNYTLTPVVAGHLYNWTIAGGTILSGQNGSNLQVAWGSTSPGSLDLTETISYPGLSCPAAAATFPVILDPWPVAAGTINGQNSVCKTSTYTYAIPVILNATSCQWVYSGAGVSIVNNGNATISITFLPAATSGTLTVRGVNNCGSGIVSGPLDIVVHNLPEVTLTPCFDLVTTSAAKKIVLKGGSPWLLGQGVFSGNRVSFNALTGFYEFDPSGASAGTYSIAYTFTNTFGCLASAQPVSITVQNNSFSCGGNLTDVRDGKVYKTAYLALRCWMTENLAYGTALTSPGPPQTDNCLPEKYCAPTDLTCAGYGGLYQWDELMDYSVTPGTKGICPPEWHVPTEAEWQSLIDNLVGGIGSPESNALNGPSMKDLLLPVGFRVLTGGLNYNDNYWAFTSGSLTATQFWSSTVNGATKAAARGLNNTNPSISKYYSSRGNAFSVRCIKN